MYNEREKLIHHQQLLSTESAAADLELLRAKVPNHPRLSEFSLSPRRSADGILFELLAVASRDEIEVNRLRHRNQSVDQNPETETEAPAEETETVEQNPETETEAPAEETESVDQNPETETEAPAEETETVEPKTSSKKKTAKASRKKTSTRK